MAFAEGEHFLPGKRVRLSWSGGPVVLPRVVPDARGSFSAPLVVLRDGGPGRQVLTVTMPGVGAVRTDPLLIVPGSIQPPDFATRN